MNPEKLEYYEGASEPIRQRLHKDETGSNTRISREMKERPPIRDAEREKKDRELTALGGLMKDVGVWWQLDGALNISMLQKEKGGDYIDEHGDVDISVLRSELPQFEERLRSRGYGLFIRTKDKDFREWRRVGAESFKEGLGKSPHIVAINEGGVIRTDADLIKIEVAIIDKDDEGFPLANGVQYPKEWLEGPVMNFHGEEIHLSHPARLVLWKIWMNRGYEEKDFDLLGKTGALMPKDIDDLENVLMTMAHKNKWDQDPDFKDESARIKARLTKLREMIAEIKG